MLPLPARCRRSIDPISILTLSLIVVALLLALLVHDPRLFLLRDSFLAGAFGLLYRLPTAQWMVIHQFLFWGTMVAAFGWAVLHGRHAGPKIEASLRQMAEAQEALTDEDRKEAPKHAVG